MIMAAQGPAWTLADVWYRPSKGVRDTVRGVTLDVAPRQMTAIIGPNGSGKSTLLRLMLGLAAPNRGSIMFGERALGDWTRRQLAQSIGVVAQTENDPLFSVRELVGMGRYPHLGPWQRERDEDRAAIGRAMDRCDIHQFAARWVTTLSGGEQQRVRLARALAQEPSTLVLDEPTASLDIRHEMAALDLLRQLRRDGVTVVIVTHNLNLAARYADSLVLLRDGEVIARGDPIDVLTASHIEQAYAWPVEITLRGDGSPQVVPRSGLMAGTDR